jgi:hypothetical protein
MSGYLSRRERQGKQEPLLQCLAGPLRRYLPDSWILSAGWMAMRFAAFPPSGHGVVHASSVAASGSVLSVDFGLAPIRQV